MSDRLIPRRNVNTSRLDWSGIGSDAATELAEQRDSTMSMEEWASMLADGLVDVRFYTPDQREEVAELLLRDLEAEADEE